MPIRIHWVSTIDITNFKNNAPFFSFKHLSFVILICSVFGNHPVMLLMCLNKKLCNESTFLPFKTAFWQPRSQVFWSLLLVSLSLVPYGRVGESPGNEVGCLDQLIYNLKKKNVVVISLPTKRFLRTSF